jgi:hypothetical protein
MANRHPSQEEYQIKTVTKYHYIFAKIAKIKNTDNTKHWYSCGAMEFTFLGGRSFKWYSHLAIAF